MRRWACIFVALLLAAGGALVRAAEPAAAAAPEPREAAPAASCHPRFFGRAYPLEVCVSFHAALLHWLDSLAGLSGRGMTSGKTRDAYRSDYLEAFGDPSERDLQLLRRYARVRVREAAGAPRARPYALTAAFFGSDDLEEALELAAPLLAENDRTALRDALQHFAPRYRELWDGGAVPRAFLDRARHDPQRRALGRFLVRVARFFEVDPAHDPQPRLILAPVRHGAGTHAQALGHHLLVEVRPGEGLGHQVAPIVHENVHFLYYRIPAERRKEWKRLAAEMCADCDERYELLLEALPTAIGQGVAAQRFGKRRFSLQRPWYHREEVDELAKAIFPLIKEALAGDATFDTPLLERILILHTTTD